MVYQPKPIDTSAVELEPALLELRELLARNAHDQWATTRLGDGWRYGPKRDDGKKENPCLVPYEELSGGEKDIDRNNALETLKAVVALGYRISKSS